MDTLNLTNKRVLIREDLNVPLADGKISNDARIRAALPSIKLALKNKARLIVMSHLGRPTAGEVNPQYSLQTVATRLSELLQQEVPLLCNLQQELAPAAGEIVLLENTRFLVGELTNAEQLARQFAKQCDIFVMDAFACAHRAHASTYGVAQFAPIACAGPLLLAEITALQNALEKPQQPVLAIVGGAKVSSKLEVLENLCQQVDALIVGGGIANTFLAAAGYPIGKSLYEADLVNTAKEIMNRASQYNCQLLLPSDVIVAQHFAADASASVKDLKAVTADDLILDVGPKTINNYQEIIRQAKTILWNGPLGVFEIEQFAAGTQALTQAIAKTTAFSIAGGGDTIAAIEKYQARENISYISTGGGAFLETLEGKKLPALEILEQRAVAAHRNG